MNELPHIGALLTEHFKKKRLFKAAFYRDMGMSSSMLQYYFTKKECKMSVLYQACHVLKHNFFRDIANSLPPEFEPKAGLPEHEAEIARLQQENKELQLKLSYLEQLLRK